MKKSTDKQLSLIFSILLALALVGAVFAEDAADDGHIQVDLDDIFETPDDDVVLEKPNDIDYRAKFEQNDKIAVKGDFIGRIGGGIGWNDTPFASKHEVVAGAYAKATVSVDARPDSVMRIFGKLKTEMNSDDGDDTWSTLEFDELYCDYSALDAAFLRLGKFYMTWGQGRLFRPGNFMEDCEDGTAFRVSLPTALDGVSMVALYKQRSKSSSGEKVLHREDLSFAGTADKTLGPVNVSAAAFYNSSDGIKISGSLKTNVLHTDLFSDCIVTRAGEKNEYCDEGGKLLEVLAGFYHEWPNSKLYGEYYYDGRNKEDPDHCLGCAFHTDYLFNSPLSMSFKWLHSVTSENGQFIGGFSISPWKHITVRAAVPWHYGDEELDKDFYEEFPIKSKLAFTLFVELKAGF